MKSIFSQKKVKSFLLFLFTITASSCGLIENSEYEEPTYVEEDVIRIAAVGDSITDEFLTSNPYPAQLDSLLGDDYHVENFGESNYAAQSSSDFPYDTTDFYQESLDFEPDIVIIMLGTNDTKSHNWNGEEQFKEEYTDLLESYLDLSSAPRVILASPPPLFLGSVSEGSIESNNIEPIRNVVEEVADEYDLEFVDVFEKTASHPEWFPDDIHPNEEGSEALAFFFYEQIED